MEEFFGCVVLAAGRFVVAASNRRVEYVAVFIDIEGEAVFLATRWAGMAAFESAILLQGVSVL